MKKILISLFSIVAVLGAASAATYAYFSDTEESRDNTITTGTIDIAVDGENPWKMTEPYELTDMKPSQVDYIDFIIHNVGSNPANIWKQIAITDRVDTPVSEPECAENGGLWENNECTGDYQAVANIDSVLRYDMRVEVYSVDPSENPEADPEWWQIIYTDDMVKMLSSLDGVDMYLGMVPSTWYMKVIQSYHMDSETTNWAQGDKLVFNLTLTAQQLIGTVNMENKDFANASNPTIIHDDGVAGVFSYGVKDAELGWEFSGVAPLANTEYAAIFYYEPWSSPSGDGWPREVYVLAKGMTDGTGAIDLSGTEDFGYDVTNMKVWLVRTSDLSSGDLGSNSMSVWNGDDYLFELGMMDYYDSGL